MDNGAVIGAALRHILTIGGTWAVSRGWLDGGMAEQLTGALAVIGAFGWSLFAKKKAAAALDKAERSPPIK